MNVPPPYMQAPRRSNTGLIIGLVVGGICLCCVLPVGLLVGGGFWAFNNSKGIVQCSMAFQGVGQGLQKYAAAHDGKLPKAETWQDDVRTFYKQSMMPKGQAGPFEQMPAEGDWGCKESDGTMTGMAFNSDLSGKKISDIKDPYQTTMLFETERPSANQHEKYKARPFETSPKMFGKHRGWLHSSVSGQPMMHGKDGRDVNINANGGNNGFNVQVDSHTSTDSKPAKTPKSSDTKSESGD